MHFRYPGETQELNELIRSKADGAFVSLRDGVTHYELSGPQTAEVVVLVHGFSVPYFIYDPTFDFLTASGYRVLRYDLFGRGWSDRPRTRSDINLFVQQLDDLLDALGITAPVSLVGLSMGGPISAAFTVRFPARVARNILIDPSGTHAIRLGALRIGFFPLVGEAIGALLGTDYLLDSIATDFFDRRFVDLFKDRYRPQMHIEGFKRSVLSTLRSGMLGDFSNTYRALASLGKPTLIFWGREDTTVPFSHCADLAAILPHARVHVIDHCGHIPHFEKPEEFNPALLDFLRTSASL